MKKLDVSEDSGSTLVEPASKGAGMTWNDIVEGFLATHRKTVTAAASTIMVREGSPTYGRRTYGDQPFGA